MTLVSIPNKIGALFWPMPFISIGLAGNATTIDAVGESASLIGRIHLEGGSGSSKTISSAGGKIYWRSTAAVWADAATNLRIGIQDVGATGVEDGTYDVQADLQPGAPAALVTDGFNETAMASGSKTIADGDVVAVVIEMTARGATDSVTVGRYSGAATNFPYSTIDISGTPVRSSAIIPITIEFDDGSIGWIDAAYITPGNTTDMTGVAVAFNSGSTPDERGLIFQVPFACSIRKVRALVGSIGSSDDFEMVLYSDPLGTPVAERTIAANADQTGSITTVSDYELAFATPFTLAANTKYAITIRPTSANSITVQEYRFTTGYQKLMRPTQLGANWYLGYRSDQTGAFTEETYTLPIIGFFLDKFDDGAGGASGPIGQSMIIQATSPT